MQSKVKLQVTIKSPKILTRLHVKAIKIEVEATAQAAAESKDKGQKPGTGKAVLERAAINKASESRVRAAAGSNHGEVASNPDEMASKPVDKAGERLAIKALRVATLVAEIASRVKTMRPLENKVDLAPHLRINRPSKTSHKSSLVVNDRQ